MIHTINDLMGALQKAKNDTRDKGATQVVIRDGNTIYNLHTVRLIFARTQSTNEKVSTCVLVTAPDFKGDVMTINHVVTAVDSIKEQSEDEGDTYIVVEHGKAMLDIGKVEITSLASPLPDEQFFPICTIRVAD